MRQLSANPSKSFKHDTRAAFHLGSLRCAAGFMVSDCSFSLPALDRQIKTAMMNDEALKAAAYLLLVVHGAAVGAEAAASRRYAAKRDEA